ncbi:MAG TPA: nucleoside diphosphate kinase regulator [Kiritimatiellia bacterium]|nr:nucleoside diphosphate kinase regulator [Kiritimatiellia bacterium]
MQTRNITVSALDCARLRDLVATAKQFCSQPGPILHVLEQELDRARVVAVDEIPPYVVTMHTSVCLVDLTTEEHMKYTLVYPGEADLGKGKLSILSDLGAAIIGFSVGDTIEWEFPDGIHRIRIGAIHFQPEATRHYNL